MPDYVIGDRRFVFVGDGDLEQMLVRRIGAPVRVVRVPKGAPAIPASVELQGPTDAPLVVDMRSVNALREQSRELGQREVVDALDRVVRRVKRMNREIEDDEADIEALVTFL